MSDQPEIIVGIDLGTTFSLVAYADERGPRIIRDDDGEGRVPSVLRFAPDGSVTIGWAARAHAIEHPTDTVYSIKRLMGIGLEQLRSELPFLSYKVGRRQTELAGRSSGESAHAVAGDHGASTAAGGCGTLAETAAGGCDAEVDAGGRDVLAVDINGQWLTPQEISAVLLKALKERAERHLKRPVRKAVITVPAYFDDSQRQATRDAGRIAGLDVVRIVNEPTAAALAYGLDVRRTQLSRPAQATDARSLPIGDKSKCTGSALTTSETTSAANPGSTIAIFDLGGGTFDVSVLRLEDDVFEVLGTHGNTHLGGDDFDREITALVQNEVRAQFDLNIDSPRTRQALRLLAERVKIRLSEQVSADIELDLGAGRVYRRTLTRGEFEDRIAPLIEKTVISCCRAMADAKLQTDQIDRVILVGGSTRIPLVRRRVEQLFGQPPYTAINPDEVVALGAAVQGQILAGGRRDLLLLDVTPLALGIETMGGAMGKLISANTRIPTRATEMFTTFVDGQTNVKINVLQGERELARDCRSLGEFTLSGVPPMPAGIPKIEVSLLIDSNGILNVSAREQRSGAAAGIQVVPTHGLTADEVKAMTLDAYRFARQDMDQHRLIDLRNQVEFDTHKAEQTLAAVGDALSFEERREVEERIRELRDLAASSDDAEAIHAALQSFGRGTVRLAELAITETLRRV